MQCSPLTASLASLLVGALLATLSGCTEDQGPAMIFFDSGGQPEAGLGFLAACEKNSDCSSSHCLTIGSSKKCSRYCSSAATCPTGWTCGAGSVCSCTYRGSQPTLCNVDGDCDGKPDKTPTTETCNGEDDDCNGAIDDVAAGTTGATLYYVDADGDGYGDTYNTAWLCKAKKGYATVGGDCDDTRKDVNPGVEEVCGDTIDNDCDGEKEDTDVCGLTPIIVKDVTGAYASGVLESCGQGPSGIDESVDINNLLAKQDTSYVKYTVQLIGAPDATACASYILRLGAPKADATFVYIYRPGASSCGSLKSMEAYKNGVSITSTTAVITGFFPGDSSTGKDGSVSFTLPKSEFYPSLPSPTYALKACTNAVADAAKDPTTCATDSCSTPVHR
jgi:hypothetical protein